jgi:ketosteroid isomerase-like protein
VSQENVEVARRCLDGWNRGDFDAWARSAHAEIEFCSGITLGAEGDGTAFRGLEGLRRYWDEWHSLWDLRVTISETRDLGNTVLAVGALKARGVASGAEIESPVAYLFVFDGGLRRKAHTYLEPTEALQAVGLEESECAAKNPA